MWPPMRFTPGPSSSDAERVPIIPMNSIAIGVLLRRRQDIRSAALPAPSRIMSSCGTWMRPQRTSRWCRSSGFERESPGFPTSAIAMSTARIALCSDNVLGQRCFAGKVLAVTTLVSLDR